MNVLLIGPRASGKSTIGRELASLLHRAFIDLDIETHRRFAEPTIRAVWEKHGESAWRRAEIAALDDALGGDEAVAALGGGTPTLPTAREHIAAARQAGRALVVYLRCSPQQLAARLRHEPGDRPSLTGGDPASESLAVATSRAPQYAALADLALDVDALSAADAAAEIAAWLAGRLG